MPPRTPDDPDDGTPVLEGTLPFMRTMWALAHALDKRSKWMRSQHGLTGPQRLAVRVIGHVPALSPGTLAKVLQVPSRRS